MRIRRTGILLAASLRLVLLSLVLASFLVVPTAGTAAAASPAAWSPVPLPAPGQAGNWVLAPGATLSCLTRAADGAVFAFGDGPLQAIFRSDDDGASWTVVKTVTASIIALAVSPGDPDVLYYATADTVFRSSDGGTNFVTFQPSPGGSGANGRRITSLAATRAEGWVVAVGVADDDAGEYGGVWMMAEANGSYTWTDTGAGPLDVLAVAFSPDYPADRQLVTVATDETDTFVMFRSGNLAWNALTAPATLHPDGGAGPVAATAGAVVLSSITTGSLEVYVGIATGTGNGDVYRITAGPGAAATLDLEVGSSASLANVDISALAVTGDCIVAGSASGTTVFTSRDAGGTWTASLKPPPGNAVTSVLAAPDAASPFLTATAGPGGGLSRSLDAGLTWDEASFIDTTIDAIVDLAPSPRFDADGTLFLLTFGSGASSLWVRRGEGAVWQRVLWTGSNGVTTLDHIALPPDYGTGSRVVYAAGDSGGTPCLWLSRDDARTFDRRPTMDFATGVPFPVDAWAVTGENALLVAGYNGATSYVYRTDNAGLYYSSGVAVGTAQVASLTASAEGSVLAGTTAGQVYLSRDGAATFQLLPSGLPSAAVSVAFDANFATSGAVYAAAAAPNSGIYRFRTGGGTVWESIDSTVPAGGSVGQVCVTPQGVLYAVDNVADTGLERSLAPALSNPSFATVTRGLPGGTLLAGLWQAGTSLWSADTARNTLWRFDDTLTRAPALDAPADASTDLGTVAGQNVTGIRLTWEGLPGATGYEWQCSDGPGFSDLPSGLSGTVTGSSVGLPALAPATTYYWRVRASSPARSPWSAVHSFTTRLTTQAVGLQPDTPAPGALDVPLQPLFHWNAVAGADAYELIVAGDINFAAPVIARTGETALPANAWACDIALAPGTTYYWKVRAVTGGSASDWSAAGIFTTAAALATETPAGTLAPTTPTVSFSGPTPTLQVFSTATVTATAPVVTAPAATAPPTPAALFQPGAVPAWLLYTVGGLLVSVVLIVAVLLVVVLRLRAR